MMGYGWSPRILRGDGRRIDGGISVLSKALIEDVDEGMVNGKCCWKAC